MAPPFPDHGAARSGPRSKARRPYAQAFLGNRACAAKPDLKIKLDIPLQESNAPLKFQY